MPRVFATKVWGFNPARWAALGFSKPGSRNALAGDLEPEDWVLHIGTRTTGDTNPRDRGKLLGIARLGENEILTELAVEPGLWADYLRINRGKAKWPFGLPMVEARQFVDRARLDEYDIIPRFRNSRLGLVLGTNAIELTANESAAVLALATEPCELFSSSELEAARAHARLRTELRKRRKVPPSFGDRTSSYEDQEAYTYVLELKGKGLAGAVSQANLGGKKGLHVYKVGQATNVLDRVAQLNFSFPDLQALYWKPWLQHRHASIVDAQAMEAHIHDLLDSHTARSSGNTETFMCDEMTLLRAWNDGLGLGANAASDTAVQTDEG